MACLGMIELDDQVRCRLLLDMGNKLLIQLPLLLVREKDSNMTFPALDSGQ